MADEGKSQRRWRDSLITPLLSEGFQPNDMGYSYSAPNTPYDGGSNLGFSRLNIQRAPHGQGSVVPADLVNLGTFVGRGFDYSALFAAYDGGVAFGETESALCRSCTGPSVLTSIITKNVVPPVVSSVSPTAGSSISRTQAITFNVTDLSPGLGRVVVLAYHGSLFFEVVHDGTSFKTPYSASSTRTAITDGFAFSIVHNVPGWPNAALTLRIIAVDGDGNESTPVDRSWTVTNPAPTGRDDTTAPVIVNFSPPVGTALAATQPVTFDVTDNSGDFRRIIVTALYPRTGIEEVVHDGDSFRGLYQTTSARSMITNGFSFSVLRSGGWPSSPTFKVFAIDTGGNEAT